MVSRGLLVELDAVAGKDAEVEEFLVSALPLVRKETATEAWFALRFGRGQYGIFDVFPDDAGLDAHLAGPVALALERRAGALLAVVPRIRRLNVLASKLPATALTGPDSRGLLLTFAAKKGCAWRRSFVSSRSRST